LSQAAWAAHVVEENVCLNPKVCKSTLRSN
jgi:hypothetical protein